MIRVAQIMGKWVGGGVESVMMNYYRHMDHSQVQFDFLCDSDSDTSCIPIEEIKSLGGNVIFIPPYQRFFAYHHELVKVLKERNYPIVHSHLNTLSVFSLFAAKCAGVPHRIAHSHSTTHHKEWKRNLIKQLLRPFSTVFANHFLCCSEEAGKWLFGTTHWNQGDIHLLPNAIDLSQFIFQEEKRKKIRQQLGINESTVLFGHVGRFVPQKNHLFMVELFNLFHQQYSDSGLVFVGKGPLEEEIKQRVSELGLNKCVHFCGQQDTVGEYYQAVDVFLFPSLYEGLGMALVEAQVAGCRCIASSGVPETAKITESTRFLPLEQSVWMEEIQQILREPQGQKRISPINEARHHQYDIQQEAQYLEQWYQKIAHSSG